MSIHLDFETRSATDLPRAGVYRYVEDPTTRPWLFVYQIGDGPRQLWVWGDPAPLDLLVALENGEPLTGHNAAFERAVWNGCMVPAFPWARPLPIEQVRCTMVRALALAMPGKLELLGPVLKTVHQKDAEGAALMKRMMRPRKVMPDGTFTWWDEPEKLARLAAYCDLDVATEVDVDARVPHLEASELRLWFADQRMNDRGVKLDMPLVRKLIDIVNVEKDRLNLEMSELTEGATKCSNPAGIKAWLNGRGIECTSIAKGEVEELIVDIKGAGDAAAARVVALRQEFNKTASCAKLNAMVACVCRDGRARGQFQFNGASQTLRWAGRLIQLQNLPRVDEERELPVVLQLIPIVMAAANAVDARDGMEMLIDSLPAGSISGVVPWISKMLRACIIAEDGHRLIGADLANIEGRISAWITFEEWKVQSFRDFDAGFGPDNYKLSYSKSFGMPIEQVGKPQRQIGKVQELALGYQGSVGAYISMAAIYGIKIPELAQAVFEVTHFETWVQTAAKYKSATNKNDLDEFQWTGVKIVVDAWRKAHPNIVQAWWDLQDAAIEAVSFPGQEVSLLQGRVRYLCTKGLLLCRLPSGDCISYVNPRLRETVEEMEREDGTIYKRRRTAVQFDTLDKGQWKPYFLYGGHQFENIVQATARSVLKHGIFLTEDAGYPWNMTVHDENVSEAPYGFGSVDEYQRLMATNPPWCPDLPLAAKAWEDTRYVK